jgi:hypothetical protein
MNKKMKLFNELSATILYSLFEKLFVAKYFSIEDFSALNTIENSDVFYDTFKYLSNEKYIKYQRQDYGSFVDVTLTSKGLSVLNAIPDSLKEKETFAQSLKNALKKRQ